MASELQIAALLYATFTSSDATERSAAEAQLKTLSTDIRTYVPALLSILAATHPDISPQIKSSAVVQLRQTVRGAADVNGLSISDRLYLSELIFQGLCSISMDASLRGSLGYSISPLLVVDSVDPGGETCRHLQPLITAALSGQTLQIQGALRTMKSVFTGITHNQSFSLMRFYQENSPTLADIARKCIAQMGNQQSELAIEAISVLEEWSYTITAILEHFELSSEKAFREFTQDFMLAEVLEKTLMMKTRDGVLGQETLIAAENSPLAVSWNNIKNQAFQSLNILLQYLTDNKKRAVEGATPVNKVVTLLGVSLPPSPFVDCALHVLEPYVLAMWTLCAHQSLPSLLLHDHCNSLMTECVSFLHKCSSEPVFYTMFAGLYKPLVLNVCLPLLQPSRTELESMQNNPDDFVSLAIDTCERQESQTLKTAAAQLLETLCSGIDGALSFVVVFVTQLIDYTVSGATPQDLGNFPILAAVRDHSQIITADEETRIEMSLMAVCVLTFSIQKRNDLSVVLEHILTKHLVALTKADSALIRSRLCLLLYFYFESMFASEEMTRICLQFLLECMNPTLVPPVVHLQACATLAAFVQEDGVVERMESVLREVMKSMVAVIPYQKEKSFFDTLQELILSDALAVRECLPGLLTGLVHKIKEELQTLDQAKRRESIIIVKCWNIIRTVTDSKHVIPQYQGNVEELLAPLFEYINVPERIEFEDDIVLVWVSFIKKSHSVSPRGWALLEHLPGVQRKYNGDFGQLFALLNAYLAYGKDTIYANGQYLSLIADMSIGCLFAAPKGKISESSASEGALILQQLILTSPPGALDQLLPTILETVMRRYAQGCQNRFFNVRLLDTFLAAIHYSPRLTLGVLAGRGNEQTKLLFVEVLENADYFLHSYDKKLAAIAVLDLISLEEKPAEVLDFLSPLFDALISILLLKRSVPAPQPAPDPQFEDLLTDDDEEFEDDLAERKQRFVPPHQPMEGSGEEAEANLALVSMVSPLQAFDETEHFRSVVNSLAQQSPALIATLVTPLSAGRKEQLRDLIHSKRVPVNSLAGDNTVVRKVVKIKRRLRK